MQRILFFITGALCLLIVSCKSQEKANQEKPNSVPQVTKEPTVYDGVTDNACAIEVAFGSYGAGIDGPTYEKVKAEIEKLKLKSTSKSIGREGEIRICLPLTEIKGNEKTEFIDQLKKIVKEGQLVSVSIR
ncbi:hypothetical protein [Aurantibacillus circumpalustris]|uniref:hypothetical protein n=1 Tax=Aurantibacillus circumpalustris TaxID=3036359 RepID=UPI00295AF6C0|nr:hypothetical protein [Aurantibacillus circumpalustris]